MDCFASIGAGKEPGGIWPPLLRARQLPRAGNVLARSPFARSWQARNLFCHWPTFFFRGVHLLSCEFLIRVCPSLHCLYKPPEMGIYGEYGCVVAGLNYQIHPNPRKACASYGHNPGCSWTTTRTASLLQTEDLGLFPPFRTGYGAQITTTM